MLEALLNGVDVLSILLLIVGFVLIGIEMLMPGISFPGITGAICLISSIFLIADTFVEGIIITLFVIGILSILFGGVLWLLSKGKVIRPIILQEAQTRTDGYTSAKDLTYLEGAEGITRTDLRPTGVGEFAGKRVDICSEGDYILKGTYIIVTQVKDGKVIVKSK